MVRLWAHESLRVFHDRLIDDGDRLWFGRLLCEMLERHFKAKGPAVLGLPGTGDEHLIVGMRGLLFGDFMVPGAEPKLYKCAPPCAAKAQFPAVG
jgi:dynein heavy chain, axonemal